MRFNRIIALCKKSNNFIIFTTDDLQWLSNGHAAYPLHGHPVYGEESIFKVASMTDKQAEKCIYQNTPMPERICTDDLTDAEQAVQELSPQIYFGGGLMLPVSTSEGLKFINRAYIRPIEDEEDYRIYERNNERGLYFVIKSGMLIRAIVMPSEIISEELVNSIADIHSQIETAFAINKEKKKTLEEQMVLEGKE